MSSWNRDSVSPAAGKGGQEEATHIAADGTVRQAHYGSGRQPWDDIKERFGAQAAAGFCAGNALKYLRRDHALKGVERARDLKHARWYFAELLKLCGETPAQQHNGNTKTDAEAHATQVLVRLAAVLTQEEIDILENPQETG